MKKLLIIILLLCTCCVSYAQDTVNEDMPWYMFMPHGDITNIYYPVDNVLFQEGHYICQYSGEDDEVIAVYGVALTFQYLPVAEDQRNGVPTMTPTVMLLNHEANGNPPTVSFVDSTNVLGTMKQCFFKYQLTNGDTFIAPSHEYYFDTPHLFNSPADTFYASYYMPEERGINYENWWNGEGRNPAYRMWHICALTTQFLPYIDGWYSDCSNGILDFQPTQHIYVGGYKRVWGFLFPIVNLRCTAPYLGLAEQNGDTARVTWWQAEAGEAYQLALTTYGGNPDTGLLVTPTDSFYTFTGLLPDTIYQVWARKACRYATAGYDTLVWSDWGRPLTFRAAVGIGEVDDMALQVTSRDGGIAVQGLAAGERAEVYDMQGRRVASLAVDGVTPPLPQGVYLLRTTAHSRARKVVLLR